jgi:predicted outer membrane repeat protein
MEYTENIIISNSQFSNLLGAISIISSNSTQKTSYTIENSSFSNNTSEDEGGALYLDEASISISDTSFFNNSAVFGGGIFFSCQDSYCTFKISSCSFIKNEADLEGGAIKWEDKKPKIDQNTTFSDNTALYGGDFASIPAMLGKSKSRYLLDNALTCTPALVCQQEIIIELLDSAGNIMTLDNSSIAVMSIYYDSENSESYSVSGIVKATAINGIFIFDSFIINGEPETNINI